MGEKDKGVKIGNLESELAVFMQSIDPDCPREGTEATPRRWIKMIHEMTKGYSLRVENILSTKFDVDDTVEHVRYDEIILSGPLPFVSMCEHHLAPFDGEAWIGYIPSEDGKVVGLSKLARLLDMYAQRFQVQERMTAQIAKALDDALSPSAVGVIVKGRHTCQCNRGVKKDGRMVTSVMLGSFRGNHNARSEFLALVELSR